MRAEQLIAGQSFEIPAIKDLMRNLVCLRVSGTSVMIDGEIRDDDTGEFRRINPNKNEKYIGLGVDVEPTDVPLINVTTVDHVVKAEGLEFKRSSKKRGRQKIKIEFPDRPFVIPKLAKELNVSPSKLFTEVTELVNAGKMKIVKVVKNKGQRGRGTKVYQVI